MISEFSAYHLPPYLLFWQLLSLMSGNENVMSAGLPKLPKTGCIEISKLVGEHIPTPPSFVCLYTALCNPHSEKPGYRPVRSDSLPAPLCSLHLRLV